MTFEERIQNWVLTDNQIKLYLERTRELRSQRNDITDSLHQYIKEKDLENATIKITDGRLKFQYSKITNPLTFRFIEDCLHECINNSDQVQYIIKYIKSKRSTRLVPDIKRFYNKTN